MLASLSILPEKSDHACLSAGIIGGYSVAEHHSRGGKTAASKLTAQERSQRSRLAAQKRWQSTVPSAPAADEPATPDMPVAKHTGIIELGNAALDVYVLSNEQRVISLGNVVHAIAGVDGSSIESYIGATALRGFLDIDSVRTASIEYSIPGTHFRGRGLTAEVFLKICRAYVAAHQAKALQTVRQKEIAFNCAILLSACADTGLIALIDEATGYQYERPVDALQVKLKAFIADELRAWEKTFPDQLWEEWGRLTNWQQPLRNRPQWWGKLVIEMIYDTLDPDVSQYLKDNKPTEGQRWHQQLTADYGVRKLLERCWAVIGIATTCKTMNELRSKVNMKYGRGAMQIPMDFPESLPPPPKLGQRAVRRGGGAAAPPSAPVTLTLDLRLSGDVRRAAERPASSGSPVRPAVICRPSNIRS